jgi:hypothetical protein
MIAMAALAALVLMVALSLAAVVLIAHRESHRAVPLRATSRHPHPYDGGPRPRA